MHLFLIFTSLRVKLPQCICRRTQRISHWLDCCTQFSFCLGSATQPLLVFIIRMPQLLHAEPETLPRIHKKRLLHIACRERKVIRHWPCQQRHLHVRMSDIALRPILRRRK